MRVGVIGGGLAGLVAARDLVRSGNRVTLYDSAALLGGQIRTRREAGFVVEDGAEGWVSADPDVRQLCEELGIQREIVEQVRRNSLFCSHGQLAELKPGEAARLLGISAAESDLGRGISSLLTGMGALTEALAADVRPHAVVNAECGKLSLERGPDGWRVVATRGSEWFDGLILAVPGPEVAVLVQQLAPQAAQKLGEIEYASNVSVSLGFGRAAVGHALDASGFVVDPGEELRGLRACAFSSSKLPGRAPAGHVLIRAFFRPSAADLAEDDREWRNRAVTLLSPVLEIRGEPERSWVARWPGALPQYRKSHAELIGTVQKTLTELGSIELAGTSFHPGGVPGAVRSGRGAARRMGKH